MSIYISIASYEDKLLVHTICDALSKAKNESDIIFGLALQYEQIPDLSFLNQNQKRIIFYETKNRPGIVEIRKQLKEMCEEDYFLQIDAHTDFYVDWDINLIKQLKRAKEIEKSDKVILSRHLNKYYGCLLNQGDRNAYKFKVNLEDPSGLWKLESGYHGFLNKEIVDDLVKSYNIGAGFIFADKKFISEIDYDDNSSVAYEEIYLSYKLFMLGWSIYSPHSMSYLAHDLLKSEIQFRNSNIPDRYIKAPNGNIVKKFAGINKDGIETYKQINDVFIDNAKNKYHIKNAVKTPKEFWEKIELLDFYLNIKSTPDRT